MEDFTRETPLTVGSPQQVIDRYGAMREDVGDYQRQLFLMDHAGLPLKTVLEQIDLLAGEVVPVLRREAEAARPAHVPSGPPTHAERVAAARAAGETHAGHVGAAEDRWTGRTAEDDASAQQPARAGSAFGL
jgi:hypothetical protein